MRLANTRIDRGEDVVYQVANPRLLEVAAIPAALRKRALHAITRRSWNDFRAV